MKIILHKAKDRGAADYGWLKTNYSFSFGNYYNPERMGFGVLRVLNDDTIFGGGGFPQHGHRDMEIVTIILEGELEHTDSMGNTEVIREGEIQIMSAGTGVLHSEYNKSKTESVKLLQIWLTPKELGVVPRYGQAVLDPKDKHNKFQEVISPKGKGGKMWLHQNAWFYIGEFDKGISIDYVLKAKENGLYVFVIEGTVRVGEEILHTRDACGLSDFEMVTMVAEAPARILLMDIPIE